MESAALNSGSFRFYLLLCNESSSGGGCNGTMMTPGGEVKNSFHIIFPCSVCTVYTVDLN